MTIHQRTWRLSRVFARHRFARAQQSAACQRKGERRQIMAIVKEQGFELNTNARNLKQQTTATTSSSSSAARTTSCSPRWSNGCRPCLRAGSTSCGGLYRRARQRGAPRRAARREKSPGILFLGGSSEDFIEFCRDPHSRVFLSQTPPRNSNSRIFRASRPTIPPLPRRRRSIWSDMGHKKIAVIGGERNTFRYGPSALCGRAAARSRRNAA